MSKNVADSVRDRLLNLSRQRNEDFNLLLVRFAIERFLYRLSQSQFSNQFVLKGATLFIIWQGDLHRPTRDLDLLGYGDSSNKSLQALITDVCNLPVTEDGLIFDTNSMRVSEIREAQEYGGKRITLKANLGSAVIPLKIDVGFGDIVFPKALVADYPALLAYPKPNLRIYTKETVIAEKFQAITVLGMANSRMKDYYDLWTLAHLFKFSGPILQRAIKATFDQRQTEILMPTPIGLTNEFAADSDKNKQWQAFVNRNRIDIETDGLTEIVAEIQNFLLPPWQSLAEGKEFNLMWQSGKRWSTGE